VDIATTDLSEIKAIICTADTWPGSGNGTPAGGKFFDAFSNKSDPVGSNMGPDGHYYIAGTGNDNLLWRMQSWMG
jgi:hypothetical protein